uniref:Uncharacterized protein n=1 Tax=Leersia perrieri TaxID=77586 RepID=A0A0D9VXG4_9ORYZ
MDVDTLVQKNTATAVHNEPAIEVKKDEENLERKRKKVNKMVEVVVNGGDLDYVLSFEEEEDQFSSLFEKSTELMLERQEMFRRQIENFGYAFVHGKREVILTDDEGEEEGDIVTDDEDDEGEEEGDIVTDDEEEEDLFTYDEDAH